jgi:hypothetical protein
MGPPHELPVVQSNETLMSGRSSPEMKTAGFGDEFSPSDRFPQLIGTKGSRKVFTEEPNLESWIPGEDCEPEGPACCFIYGFDSLREVNTDGSLFSAAIKQEPDQ